LLLLVSLLPERFTSPINREPMAFPSFTLEGPVGVYPTVDAALSPMGFTAKPSAVVVLRWLRVDVTLGEPGLL
jgi:hypothetical protein